MSDMQTFFFFLKYESSRLFENNKCIQNYYIIMILSFDNIQQIHRIDKAMLHYHHNIHNHLIE